MTNKVRIGKKYRYEPVMFDVSHPPFNVKPGDIVSPDTVIGIIEVMKLMNRVSAGVSGVVTAVVAPSGEMVEHGDPLIRVKLD